MANQLFQSGEKGQKFVKVTPIVAGTSTMPERLFIAPIDPDVKQRVPCMCFLVEHPKQRFMFDLGLRSNPRNYIPQIQAHLHNRHPVTFSPSVVETLQSNNIDPASLESVILSHVHWDHHGDPTSFPNARFFVGHGSLDVLQNGTGKGSHSHFDSNLFADSDHSEFAKPEVGQSILADASDDDMESLIGNRKAWPATWRPLGPFPAAADMFGDGSVFLVPAPGHLTGHLNLLCRVGPSEWMYLAGDAFHDVRLLTGEKDIATWYDNNKTCCVHIDLDQAEETIDRIRQLMRMGEQNGQTIDVVASHDSVWLEKNQHRCAKLRSPSLSRAIRSRFSRTIRSMFRRISALCTP